MHFFSAALIRSASLLCPILYHVFSILGEAERVRILMEKNKRIQVYVK